MDNLRLKIEGWKNLAELFLKEDKKVYIKDLNGDYYFADIIFVGEEKITIECFAPDSRAGKSFTLYWISIYRFDEYKEEVENGRY